MDNFKPEFIDLSTVNLPSIPDSNIDFYEVDFYPVIDVIDGKTGPIALDGRPRTFPIDSLHGYNGRQLSKEEFFKLFPETKTFFEQPDKQAA